MSCPNFETQENFKLFLWDFERPSDEVLNENILETNDDITSIEDITESMRDEYAEDMYNWECSDIIDNFSETVNDILHTLKREIYNYMKSVKKSVKTNVGTDSEGNTYNSITYNNVIC